MPRKPVVWSRGAVANPKEVLLRLMSRTELAPNGCWEYKASPIVGGYQRMLVNYEFDLVHRWSYRVFYGEVPEGLFVLHDVCDNPPCWKPAHLLAGTQSKNIQDMHDRGRGVLTRPAAKLTLDQVAEIRASSGESQKALAERYNVHRATIYAIRHRRTWAS